MDISYIYWKTQNQVLPIFLSFLCSSIFVSVYSEKKFHFLCPSFIPSKVR